MMMTLHSTLCSVLLISIRVTWSVSGWIVEQKQSVVMWNKISLSTFQAKHKTDVEVKVNFVNSVWDSMLS